MNVEKAIIALVSFVIGAAVGALLGLVFAPMSGRELQYRARKEGQLQAQRAKYEWNQGMSSLNKQVDSLRQQVSTLSNKG